MRMPSLRSLLASLALVVASPAQAIVVAPSITLTPSTDGAVQYSGVLGYEVFTDGASVVASRSGGNNVRNAIFEFALGSIPVGSVIHGARFDFTLAGTISNTDSVSPVSFYGHAGDGLVTADDHQNNTAGILLATVDFDTSTPAGTPFSIALGTAGTDLLGSLLADGLFTLRVQTVNFVTFSIAALEHATRPAAALVVDYTPVPLPGALVLCVPALAGLARYRRRAA